MNTPPKPTDPEGIDLDTAFEAPNRKRWVELALSGLAKGSNNAAGKSPSIGDVRRQTLDGIDIQALYDAAPDPGMRIPTPAAQGTWDNRLSVSTDTSSAKTIANTQQRILQGLQGGISSLELYCSTDSSLATCLQDVQLAIAPISLRTQSDGDLAGTALSYQQFTQQLIALASEQGIAPSKLRCSFNADPIGVALAQGARQPIDDALTSMAEFAASSSAEYPRCHSVLVDTAIHHNAGATPVAELHAAIATATVYAEHMLAIGMSMQSISNTLVFQVAIDADTLLGVAKLRALQALWQHTLEQLNQHYSLPYVDLTSTRVSIVAETSRRYLSLSQPWNNHLRNLAACTAACMAGAQTMIVHPHNALDADSNSEAEQILGQRMARNIPIILERESGLRKVADPWGGSYAIEHLTQQFMQRTWNSLTTIDESTAWLSSLSSGQWQQSLATSQQQRVAQLEAEQTIAVGVNRFIVDDKALSAASLQADLARTDKTTDAVWAIPPLVACRDAHHFEQSQQRSGEST